MSSNTISEAFGLTRMITDDQLPVVIENHGIEKMPGDFDKSRSNISELIDIAMKAIKNLHQLADTSQSARYYEALNATLKTAVEANKAAIEIHKEMREANIIKKPPQQVNNNLYVGSTAELQKVIESMKDKTNG